MPQPIDEAKAKQALSRILGSFTAGSVLHLLADVFDAEAEKARLADDVASFQRCKVVQQALFVVGIGIDGIMPK